MVGAWAAPLDIAPNFVGTLMGLTGMITNILGNVILPYTKPLMVAILDEDMVWTGLFLLVMAVIIVTNIIFLLFYSAETQEWNELKDPNESDALRRKKSIVAKIQNPNLDHLAYQRGLSHS